MKAITQILLVFSFLHLGISTDAQTKISEQKIKETILKATKYMVQDVSTNGGYVWYYTPDLSRQWGEMNQSCF